MFNGFYMVLRDVPITEIFQHIPTITCGQLIEALAPIVLALIAMFYNEEKPRFKRRTLHVEIDE